MAWGLAVRRHWASLMLLLFFVGSISTAGSPASQQPAGTTTSPSSANATAEGAQVWATNCVRCHSVPEKIPPREVRAVLRQMRIRANLSTRDEQLLIKFLTP